MPANINDIEERVSVQSKFQSYKTIDEEDQQVNEGVFQKIKQYFQQLSLKLQSQQWYRILQYIYFVWQLCSIVIVFSLDVEKFIHYLRKSSIDHTSWTNFMCMGAILAESPNNITIILGYSQILLASDIDPDTLKPPETDLDDEQIDNRGLGGYRVSRALIQYLRQLVIVGIFYIAYSSVFVIFFIPGAICFPIVLVMVVINLIMYFATKIGNVNHWQDINEKSCKMCVGLVVLLCVIATLVVGMLVYVWSPLLAINLFSGKFSYLDCIKAVFDERSVKNYYQYLKTDWKMSFTFVCTLFG